MKLTKLDFAQSLDAFDIVVSNIDCLNIFQVDILCLDQDFTLFEACWIERIVTCQKLIYFPLLDDVKDGQGWKRICGDQFRFQYSVDYVDSFYLTKAKRLQYVIAVLSQQATISF